MILKSGASVPCALDPNAYEAFGELLDSTGGSDNAYRYTGEQYDSGLDQYYLRARYYDQGVGRFTQMDTWMGRNQDPITLHKYLYANADPIRYMDPSGNSPVISISVQFNVQAVLTTASLASSGISIYSSATDADGFTAKDAGFAAIIALSGPAAGKLIGILGRTQAAKTICSNVCGLLNKAKIIGPAIKYRGAGSIRFTQNSIGRRLSNGDSVDDLIEGLRSGAIKPKDLPPIRIFRKDGQVYSLDNRRLYAAQKAGVKVKTVGATQEEISREAWKFTTKNGGSSVKVRGN